jgi:DNA-binding NarL/FixJ family response regulator
MTTETYAIRGLPRALAASSASRLTGRQVAVLRLIAQGRDIDAIADELGYSSSTIKKDVHLTLHRVGARNRTHAVALAIRAGLI